jgi:hypothetical protein
VLQPSDWEIIDQEGNVLHVQDLPAFRALRSGQVVDSTVLGFYNLGNAS